MLGGADVVIDQGPAAGACRSVLARILADVAVQLQVAVILVVGMRLGCINHALLTAEAIARDGLQLAGWVANQPGRRCRNYAEQPGRLRRFAAGPLLGEIPSMRRFRCRQASNVFRSKPFTG